MTKTSTAPEPLPADFADLSSGTGRDRESALRRYRSLAGNPLRPATLLESFGSVILGSGAAFPQPHAIHGGLNGDIEALGLDMRNAMSAYRKEISNIRMK